MSVDTGQKEEAGDNQPASSFCAPTDEGEDPLLSPGYSTLPMCCHEATLPVLATEATAEPIVRTSNALPPHTTAG